MFPSLAALGGTLGLLGLHEPELLGSEVIGNLNVGYQRHIDSCPVDYAALMRDPVTGLPDSPIADLYEGPPTARVALVGGGIANIIAAYELSRIGIRCTVYEASSYLGGRLRSNPVKTTSTAWSEEGAVRFPRGGLMWHYVAQWVRSVGLDPVNDRIEADSFPSPGTVPTMLAYQGESYEWSATLDNLPPIVREAKALFADFISGLNDGRRDPDTVYFAEAVRALNTPPDDKTTGLLESFWKAMLEEFDGSSFAEVLETEVFANAYKPTDLMAAFGTVGVGTGGFSHLYDAAFLEVLRILLWDISEDFMLPERHTYPYLFGHDDGGAQGFAMALARAAWTETQRFAPGRTFDEMFRVDSPVARITQDPVTGVITFKTSGLDQKADFAIVAMTSRAMQQVELDLPYALNPLLPTPLVSDLVSPSCQAAIKRLEVVPGYRMNTELPSPRIDDTWPQDADGNKILCFVTDERPRLAYVLPEVPVGRTVVRATVADAYGSDADKFSALRNIQTRREAAVASLSYGLQPNGAGGDGAAKPVADLLDYAAEVKDVDWSYQPNTLGAFKVDKPADNYFSSSLFYHYQQASPANPGPHTSIFLSGDSVGHLGGWVEGAMMSAINAVVGVCSQIEQQRPGTLAVAGRFKPLLEDDVRLFHRWKDISGRAPSTAGLISMVRLGNRHDDPALPPEWRYLGRMSAAAYDAVTLSKSGDFLVAALDNQLVFNARSPDGQWAGQRVFYTAGLPSVPSVSVATEKGTPQAQLMWLDSNSLLWHGTYEDGAWRQFWPAFGVKAKRVALDVEGGHAQVVVVGEDNQLRHCIRFRDRSWSTLNNVSSPSGATVFYVRDAAVSCTSFARDLTTVAALDQQTSSVYVAIRDGSAYRWRPWVLLPSPRPPGAEEPLRAVKVRVVVLDDANNAQVWALFSDGSNAADRLYTSVRNTTMDPTGQTWTTFQPVPYPLSGAAGPIIIDFAPTLPHAPLVEPALPGLSTVVYAAITSGYDAEQSDQDEVSHAP